MNCEGARELFSDYEDGHIDKALGIQLRGHLSDCASCKREFEQFKQTWGMLGALPDIAPPVSFRHDLIMQLARTQHERERTRRERSLSFLFGSLSRKLVPSRAAIAVWGAAALLFVISGIPEKALHYANSGFKTTSSISESFNSNATDDGAGNRTADTGMSTDNGAKQVWRSRAIGRNTLWVTVDPTQNRDGRMVYRVLLSINENALINGETCGRIGAEVYLLPHDQYGLVGKTDVNTVWQGSVLADSPVVVPVIIDRSQSEQGTVNLLVVWRFRGRTFSQIVYIPARYRGSLSKDMYDISLDSSDLIKNRNDLYSTLQGIAQDYGVIVIANSRITEKSAVSAPGQGKLDWVLRSTLKPAGIDWLMADHSIYVDRKYL